MVSCAVSRFAHTESQTARIAVTGFVVAGFAAAGLATLGHLPQTDLESTVRRYMKVPRRAKLVDLA